VSERDPPPTVVHNHGPVGTQILVTGATTFITSTPLTWERLAQDSRAWEDDISVDLGGRVSLLRASVLTDLQQTLDTSRVSIVLGESGTGKSALVRRALARVPAASRIILYASDAIELEQTRSPSLSTLLATPPTTTGVLVLDALERADDHEAIRAIARIVRALRVNREGSWSLVLTCSHVAWPRISSELGALGVTLAAARIVVPRLERSELDLAISAFPTLRHLVAKPDLLPLLSQAKVLDLLARASVDGTLPALSGLVGESELVAWFSERYVRPISGDLAPAVLVQRLARDQADAGRFVTPLSDLGAEASAVPYLARQGILIVRDEVVRFAHDLYADYARARWLIGEVRAGRWDGVRERIEKRPWRRALYLLLAESLERQQEEGAILDVWNALRSALSKGFAEAETAMDLLLEASCLSSSAPRVLIAIEPELFKDTGSLLRRMLNRFLFAASIPHPAVIEAVSGKSQRVQLAAEAAHRLPDGPVWPPLLRWLVSAAPRAIEVASDETFALAEAWLLPFRNIQNWPFLKELADVVLTLAERDAEPHYRRREERRRLFRVLLAVLPLVDPSRCSAVLRARAGLVPPPASAPAEAKADVPSELQYLLRPIIPRELVGPWPGGPRVDPDDDFVAVALTDPGAVWLVEHDAASAREIFGALLVSAPHERDGQDFYRRDAELRGGEETKPSRDFPPLRALLEKSTPTGLEFATFVLNFAADRWAEMASRRSAESSIPGDDSTGVELQLTSGSRVYAGEQAVFYWNLGSGPPSACAIALTLEEWLTKHALAGTLEREWLATLLETSRSAAMLGVLLDIALLQPDLFETCLEPLATSPVLALWTTHRQMHLQVGHGGFAGAGDRAHLQQETYDITAPMFARRQLVWPAIERARQAWRLELVRMPEGNLRNFVESWVELFDPARWSSSAESKVGYLYNPPDALSSRQARDAGTARTQLALMGLSHRCLDAAEGRVEWGVDQIVGLLGALEQLPPLDPDVVDLVGGVVALRSMVAAVAVLRFESWLTDNEPERVKVVAWLLAPLEQSPSPRTVFSRSDPGVDNWHALCARAIPTLLARSPMDKRLRRALARLTSFPQDATVRLAFSTSRALLRPSDFSSLLHLGVRVARRLVLRHVAEYARLAEQGGLTEGRDGRVAPLDRDDHVDTEAFVSGKLPGLPSDWRSIANTWPRGFDQRLKQSPHAQGFEEAMILAMFWWLDGELAGAQALQHVKTVQQLSAPLLARLSGPWTPPFSFRRAAKGALEKTRRIRKKPTLAERMRGLESWRPAGPFESDEVPIKWTATLILRSEDEGQRRRLWEPWLRLPLESDFWIGRLFERLYEQGFDVGGLNAARFTRVLDEILSFVGTDGWLATARRRSAAYEVAMAAFGRGSYRPLSERWSAARHDVAVVIARHVERFVGHTNNWPGCYTFGCELLLTPAFDSQRIDALSWFADAATDHVLEDDESAEALTHFLDAVSRRPREEFAACAGAQARFDALLGRLERQQHPLAMALSRRLARGNP
jgi:hypothetical protein